MFIYNPEILTPCSVIIYCMSPIFGELKVKIKSAESEGLVSMEHWWHLLAVPSYIY